jgi:hypothetical protein
MSTYSYVIYGISTKTPPLPSESRCSTSRTGRASLALSLRMLFVDLVLSGDEIWFATLTEECGVRVYLTTKCFGLK